MHRKWHSIIYISLVGFFIFSPPWSWWCLVYLGRLFKINFKLSCFKWWLHLILCQLIFSPFFPTQTSLWCPSPSGTAPMPGLQIMYLLLLLCFTLWASSGWTLCWTASLHSEHTITPGSHFWPIRAVIQETLILFPFSGPLFPHP